LSAVTKTHVLIYAARFYVAHLILFIDELLSCASCIYRCQVWHRALSLRYAHAMRVFDVRASSSPLGYPCAKFFSVAPLTAELARGEKSRTQSVSLSLFDMPGTEAFASEQSI